VAVDCLSESNGSRTREKEVSVVANGIVEDLVSESVTRSEEARKESLADGVLEKLMSLLISEHISSELAKPKQITPSPQPAALLE